MSMEQENKELLLKSLCAGLPYGVIVKTDNAFPQKLEGITFDKGNSLIWVSDGGFTLDYMNCKPYLFPLSSMTEDQRELRDEILDSYNSMEQCYIKLIDWYNKNHFDYMNLIPKGLAIDCTNLNIY